MWMEETNQTSVPTHAKNRTACHGLETHQRPKRAKASPKPIDGAAGVDGDEMAGIVGAKSDSGKVTDSKFRASLENFLFVPESVSSSKCARPGVLPEPFDGLLDSLLHRERIFP